MLVLGRKLGERIRIGTDVWVKVMAVQQGRVRLGIEAPATTRIVREELDGTQERSQATEGQS